MTIITQTLTPTITNEKSDCITEHNSNVYTRLHFISLYSILFKHAKCLVSYSRSTFQDVFLEYIHLLLPP